MTISSRLNKRKHFNIITFLLIVIYLLFVLYSFNNTFNHQFSVGFLIYILFFLPVIFLPIILILLIKKWGKFYVLFLIFSVFYIFTFLIFILTIANYQKFRFFDPFLQINPVLSKELLKPKADNETRILLLGGSTTRNIDLPVNKKYELLLQQKLSLAYPEKKISVFNAGMDWFTSRHSLIAYTNYYQHYNADIVLIMHTINDVVRSFTPLDLAQNNFKYDYSHFYGPAARAAFPEKSYPERIINNLKYFVYKYILKQKDTYVDYDTTTYKSALSYRYFLQQLIKNIKSDNSMAVIVTEASIYNEHLSDEEKLTLWFANAFCYHQANNNYNKTGRQLASVKSLENAMNYFNKIAIQLSAKNNIPCIDLASYIPKNKEFLADDVHFTEKGCETAASVVADYIIKNKLIRD